MLTEPQPRNLGDILATSGSAFLFLSSFMPYWASLEIRPADYFVSFGGPMRFSLWDAYPSPVVAGAVLSLLILPLGIARLTGRGSVGRVGNFYLIGGALITLVMLYGVYEGPTDLFDGFLRLAGGGGDGPVSLDFLRGPLIYASVAAGLMILVGGLLARRQSSRTDPPREAVVAVPS